MNPVAITIAAAALGLAYVVIVGLWLGGRECPSDCEGRR